MYQIDLHIHSIYSDGTDTVEKIVKQSQSQKLDLIAITDHNTLDHITDLKKYAKKYKQKALAGIELSTAYHHHEIHVLGYFPISDDFESSRYNSLHQFLAEYKQTKVIQNESIIMKLKKRFPDISLIEFYQFTNSQNINRVHIAKYMMYKGYVKDMNTAFNQYIGTHCPFYVKRKEMSLQRGIEAIKAAEGVSVIAHLGEYEFNDKDIDLFIKDCIQYKIDGFECYHPLNDEQIIEIIQKHSDMILTAGSDYHGLNKKNNDLGMPYNFSMNKMQQNQYNETIEKAYYYFKKWVVL